MAKVFIEETTLTAIGDAIRGKEGTTDLVPVNDMASRISAIETGGGGGNEPTAEELTLTGNCGYRFANNGWNWVINKYGNRITTRGITDISNMFNNSTAEEIPFIINVDSCNYLNRAFYTNKYLKICPKIRGTITWTTSTTMDSMLYQTQRLRDIEDLFTPEMIDGYSSVKVTSASSCPRQVQFSNMYSLRKLPSWWYKFKINPENTAFPRNSYSIYYSGFADCYVLDEVVNIPVWKCQAAQTSDMFSNTFKNCSRVKRVTFETNSDGTPIVAQWKSQIIDLSQYVGYTNSRYNITSNYNSGITLYTEVANDSSYQAFKNDPDWWTEWIQYSRYNHDSAVETINSLPDTSAYLATAGGTNTIKFKGDSGSATDGGAIQTLTEEEIAVATAKGWTVTFV